MTIHNRNEHILFIILVYLINLLVCAASENCYVMNSCKCQFENGTGIDLSAIKINNYYYAVNQNLSYYFHPCSDAKDLPITMNDCKGGYSLCEFNATDNKDRNLGTMENSELKLISNSEAYLIYNRNNIQTTVTLICTNIVDSYLYVPLINTGVANSTQKNLMLFSPQACLYQVEPPLGMSTGSVLIILFLSLIGIYLFMGVMYRIFVAGASGIEVIPNLEFWRDFPSLVKDGVKFIQNGCKVDPLVQNNQDSYDAI